jgi:hypothetical protein
MRLFKQIERPITVPQRRSSAARMLMRPFRPVERTVATVGLPGHGKTVFLAGLFWDSFFSLSNSFDRYAVIARSPKADEVFYGHALNLKKRILPITNPRTMPEPAMLEFRGIPSTYGKKRRSAFLTFYDVDGSVFSNDRLAQEYAPFLAEADDIVFLFDPTHPDFSALSAVQLVDLAYRVAGTRKRKNIIITLTKMDELRSDDEWGEMIHDLWPDEPPEPGASLAGYFTAMEMLSDSLRRWWLAPEQQAKNLINRLPESTRFCAISSLGHQPLKNSQGRLMLIDDPKPFRVRDPLFWIFRAAGVM